MYKQTSIQTLFAASFAHMDIVTLCGNFVTASKLCIASFFTINSKVRVVYGAYIQELVCSLHCNAIFTHNDVFNV